MGATLSKLKKGFIYYINTFILYILIDSQYAMTDGI